VTKQKKNSVKLSQKLKLLHVIRCKVLNGLYSVLFKFLKFLMLTGAIESIASQDMSVKWLRRKFEPMLAKIIAMFWYRSMYACVCVCVCVYLTPSYEW